MKSSWGMRFFWSFALLFTTIQSNAEILHGVRPMDTLGDVKLRYPNAKFEKINAAWVTEMQAFISMSGQGFPGTLRIVFLDPRPTARKDLLSICANESAVPNTFCIGRKETAAKSDDDALSLNWVRWVPQQPIPIARYISKYGEPSRYDFDDATMTPTARWDRVELRAQLSDDKKLVEFIDTNFTKSEWAEAWKRTRGYVPEYLRDEKDRRSTPKPEPKANPK